MKRYIILVLTVFLIIAMLTGCSGNQTVQPTQPEQSDQSNQPAQPAQPSPAKQEVIRWEVATHYMANSMNWQIYIDFADRVLERTNGVLDLSIRGGGELPFTGTEFLRVVSDGTIQMAGAVVGYVSGDVEAAVIPSWPMMAGTTEQLEVVLPALLDVTNREIAEKGFNVEIVCSFGTPLQAFFGIGNAVTKLEDLKGLKIRTFSAEGSEIVMELGANPISMAYSEVIPSLQRKVIDGAVTGPIGANDNKWYDVISWGYLMPLLGSADHLIVNKDALASLPEDVRAILLEEAQIMRQEQVDYTLEVLQSSIDNLEANGVTMTYPTDEEIEQVTQMASALWDKWAQDSPLVKEALDIAKEALGYK